MTNEEYERWLGNRCVCIDAVNSACSGPLPWWSYQELALGCTWVRVIVAGEGFSFYKGAPVGAVGLLLERWHGPAVMIGVHEADSKPFTMYVAGDIERLPDHEIPTDAPTWRPRHLTPWLYDERGYPRVTNLKP